MPNKVAPFWLFYQLYEKDERRKGRNLSADELKAEASQLWEDMDVDDRAWFVDNAKHATAQQRERRWRQQGKRSQLPPNQQQPELSKSNTLFSSILERSLVDVVNKMKLHPGGAKDFEFCFFDVNVQCHVRTASDREVRPCEVSLCRYSIADGISARWHGFLYQGRPTGMPPSEEAAARRQCSESHCIPFNGMGDASRNVAAFWRSIKEFKGSRTLIAGLNTFEVFGSLIFIVKTCAEDVVPVTVDSRMLMQALQGLAGSEPFSSQTSARQINMSACEDEIDMACSFHQKGQGWKNCSLLRVTKMAYEFSRLLSSSFKVENLIPGKHTPAGKTSIPVIEFKEEAEQQLYKQHPQQHQKQPQHQGGGYEGGRQSTHSRLIGRARGSRKDGHEAGQGSSNCRRQ